MRIHNFENASGNLRTRILINKKTLFCFFLYLLEEIPDTRRNIQTTHAIFQISPILGATIVFSFAFRLRFRIRSEHLNLTRSLIQKLGRIRTTQVFIIIYTVVRTFITMSGLSDSTWLRHRVDNGLSTQPSPARKTTKRVKQSKQE